MIRRGLSSIGVKRVEAIEVRCETMLRLSVTIDER